MFFAHSDIKISKTADNFPQGIVEVTNDAHDSVVALQSEWDRLHHALEHHELKSCSFRTSNNNNSSLIQYCGSFVGLSLVFNLIVEKDSELDNQLRTYFELPIQNGELCFIPNRKGEKFIMIFDGVKNGSCSFRSMHPGWNGVDIKLTKFEAIKIVKRYQK